MPEINPEKLDELTLILLYASGWHEGEGPYRARRTWKGYPWEILRRLHERGLITDPVGSAKSVYLTAEGEQAAAAAAKRLGGVIGQPGWGLRSRRA